VILIMADDLGYETIGVNGGTSYRTPTLDGLAAKGIRFEHCYVQPLCTPTRVQLMTGAYNVRNYITFGQMDPGLTTFGNLFQSAGYVTCITGKWQLGRDSELPKKFGFAEHCLWQHTRRPPRYANPGLEINGEEKDFKNGDYGPDIVNEYACDFVRRNQEKPFFLYYPMMLTHGPYQPTPDSKTWDPKAMGENVNQRAEHFGDMVEYMDKLIGRLVTTLDETGTRERTLLIFIGDNGTGKGTKSQMGDRTVIGGKGTTTAAGMHVPCIVSWPSVITSGRVSGDLVDSTDFLPTICDAAEVKLPAKMTIDGRSFLPQLRDQAGSPRDWIYSWYSPRGETLRELAFDQRYKLYRDGQFFDLTKDPLEQQPLRVADLLGEPAAAATRLGAALAQFDGARPANLPQPSDDDSAKKKAKKAKKNRKGAPNS
jgi:arylsulfatase A